MIEYKFNSPIKLKILFLAMKSEIMRSFLLYVICVIILCCSACSAKQEKSSQITNEEVHDIVYNPRSANDQVTKRAARLEVVGKKTFDFGTIKSGERVSHRFIIKNIGDAPMTIMDSNASCGCTVPYYRDGQIEVQDTSSVLVVFDSKNRQGKQNKKVTVYTNTVPNETLFTLIGFVE